MLNEGSGTTIHDSLTSLTGHSNRPVEFRQPDISVWVLTNGLVAYYPLHDNGMDYSGNNFDLSRASKAGQIL